MAACCAGPLHGISLGTAAEGWWLYLQGGSRRHGIAVWVLPVVSATGGLEVAMPVYHGAKLLDGLAAGESQADIESLSVLLGVETVHEDLHSAVEMWRSCDSRGCQQKGTVGECCFV